MAFVFKKDRNTSLIDKSKTQLGPGQYEILKNNESKKFKAPFNSSGTNHEFLFNLNPGPGSYEYTNNKMNPNQAFKSRVDRFSEKVINVPGPGEYKQPSTFKADRKQVILQETTPLNAMTAMKNTPSIPTRNQVQGYEQDDLGNLIMQAKPDSTEEVVKDDNQQYINTQKNGGQSFGKSKRDPFKNQTKEETAVGPGQQFSHEGEVVRKKKTGVIYNQKTFVHMKSSKSLIEKDDTAPGPGEYESHNARSAISKVSKPLRYQFFGSTEDRFRDQALQNVGPGSYNIKDEKTKIGMPNVSSARFDVRTAPLPGPGSYASDNQFEKIKSQPISRSNNFITNVDRFKSLRKNQVPGPGQQQPDSKIPKKANPSSNFKSESIRLNMQKIKEERVVPGPGHYQDNQTLIKEKKGKNIGFNSSEAKMEVGITSKGYILTSNEKIALGPGQYNPENSRHIELGGGNFGSNKERWENDFGNNQLGPGEQSDKSNWEKKSYNVHFRK